MRNDWFEIPLDEYVTDGRIQLGRGKVISKKDIQSNLGPYPIYSSSARQRGKFGEYGEYMFNEELITGWSIDGGGKLFFRQKHKYSITNVTGFLRIHASELDYKFLYYLLSQQHALLKFDYSKKAHPSVIRKVYRVVHPSLSEQRKIAAILTSMDDTIEKSQAVIDQVQVVKRGLMHELFTRGLALESGSPREWDKEPIGNLFTLQLGKMLNKKARETLPRFPYLGNKDVRWGRFSFRKLRKMHFDDREREKFRLVPGDLLVCEGGEIGRAALWTGEFDCYYQKAVHRLRARDTGRVEPRFIFALHAVCSHKWSAERPGIAIQHCSPDKREACTSRSAYPASS